MESIDKKYYIDDVIDQISSSTDKSVDSLAYASLRATLNKVNEFYENITMLYDELFGDSQSITYLQKRVEERGLSIKGSTNAYLKVESNCEVPVGTRFTLKDYTYIVTEKLGTNLSKVMCETLGTEANSVLGKLTPINYVEGLTEAVMTEVLIPARDDEDVDSLRARYIDSFGIKPYGGNKIDYLNMLEQVDGVYSAKIIRGGNGPGTVVIIILDNELKSGSEELSSSVKEVLDPLGFDGEGVGLAPVGHTVSVVNVNEVPIDIEIHVESLYENENDTLQSINNSVSKYFDVLKKSWHKENIGLILRVSYLQHYILQDSNIIDVLSLSLNGAENNIKLTNYDIPAINTINLRV